MEKQAEVLRDWIEDIKAELEDVLGKLEQAEKEFLDLAYEHLHTPRPRRENLWTADVHECKLSPINQCVYNFMTDPCLDDCLFCAEPYERK
jgi:hypothetical protein